LLEEFIPKRFGVGTGVVIDRDGGQSNQQDIVIYDAFLYPSLFALASVHLFPVDIVCATIEIKTTLNCQEANGCKKNIASVKRRPLIPGKYNVVGTGKIPRAQIEDRQQRGDVYAFGTAMEQSPSPPFGCVFAYNSTVKQSETFKDWFTPNNQRESQEFPDLVGCLDQGVVLLSPLRYNGQVRKAKGKTIMAMENDTDPLIPSGSEESIAHNGIYYPVKKVRRKPYAIDQSKVLLQFLLLLNDLLSYRRFWMNPEVDLRSNYFPVCKDSHLSI